MGVLLYGALAFLWHLQQPIAWHPQLDGKENLHLAASIAEGDFGDEPFYRAMLYPLLLALLRFLVGPDWLPLAASFAGLAAHWVAAGCVARLAERMWGTDSAGTFALAVYGLNPVLLHFALEPLDMTAATTLCLLGLVVLRWGGAAPAARLAPVGSGDVMSAVWRGREPSEDLVRKARAAAKAAASEASPPPWMRGEVPVLPSVGRVFAGGFLVGLAVLARPHFLPVVLLLPFVLAAAPLGGRLPWRRAALVWVAGAVCLAGFGTVNYSVGGEFRILPWQGAFNLYAANRDNANGKYFTQSVFHAELPDGMNPARAEAEALYARETGEAPPFDIDEQNAFWRGQFRASASEDPGRFAALQLRKVYYLFHDFEQYNNKTYAYHKARSPVLRWNPLGWGALLVLAVGVVVLARPRPVSVRGWLLLAAAYAAAMGIYYVSARFRIPLVSVLAVTAGGWGVFLTAAFRTRAGGFRRMAAEVFPGRRGVAAVCLMAGAAAVVFPPFFEARDTRTFIQDEMLLANAAAEGGADAEAADFARRALARDPSRQDGLRIFLVSAYNLALAGRLEFAGVGEWETLLDEAERFEPRDPAGFLVQGVVFWNSGQRERAVRQWAEGVERFGAAAESSRKCLAIVGVLPPEHAARLADDPEARAIRAILR